jgi:hypothetical protein
MKNWKLILWGVLPLPLGYLLNYAMWHFSLSGLLLTGTNLLLLLLWGYLAYRLSSPRGNPLFQALLLCSFGLLALALVLFQELVLGQYWFNFVGTGSQMFFLPFLSLGFAVSNPLVSLLMSPIRIWPGYIAAWLLMLAAAWVGCYRKRRRG